MVRGANGLAPCLPQKTVEGKISQSMETTSSPIAFIGGGTAADLPEGLADGARARPPFPTPRQRDAEMSRALSTPLAARGVSLHRAGELAALPPAAVEVRARARARRIRERSARARGARDPPLRPTPRGSRRGAR